MLGLGWGKWAVSQKHTLIPHLNKPISPTISAFEKRFFELQSTLCLISVACSRLSASGAGYISVITAERVNDLFHHWSGHSESQSFSSQKRITEVFANIGWLFWQLTFKNIAFLTVDVWIFWSFDGQDPPESFDCMFLPDTIPWVSKALFHEGDTWVINNCHDLPFRKEWVLIKMGRGLIKNQSGCKPPYSENEYEK